MPREKWNPRIYSNFGMPKEIQPWERELLLPMLLIALDKSGILDDHEAPAEPSMSSGSEGGDASKANDACPGAKR